MKIIVIDTYYQNFLEYFRKSNSKYKEYSYDTYKTKLLGACFGTSDFYSYNLNKNGLKAEDIVANDEILQKRWAKENNIEITDNWLVSKLQSLPYMYRFLGKPNWIQDIAFAQIKKYKPDVIYMQDLSILNPKTLKKVKKYCRLLVGQIASPPPPEEYLKCFDLIITSFPHFAEKFKKMEIKSEYQKLAFESRVLEKIGKQKRIYDVTFIGSFSPHHQKGTKILEKLAKKIPIHIWGQGMEFLSPMSPLRKNYHGEAWGLDMYKILAQSKIVINRHIGVAGNYANNMRLYEATGMGAMLITDDKINLNDLFEVGKEVIAYKDEEDLVKKVNYFLKNNKQRMNIAEKGQEKTLKEHSYVVRMKELSNILDKYL